jgi:hypothetical protein
MMTAHSSDNEVVQSWPVRYVIIIEGHLDPHWSEWFENMTITHLDCGETILVGLLTDQTALHTMLTRLHTLNLTLISVVRDEEK